MDSNNMDTSEDGISTARPLRDTKARQDLKERQQAKLNEKREQLKELENVQEGDLSPSQMKKITNLRRELGIDATSKSVDPQSKPQYPGSTSGDNEDRNSGNSPQTPASGDSPSSKNERPGFYSGSPSTQTAVKTSPDMSHEGGVAIAYCRCKSFKDNSRIIYCFGPPDHSKHEFGPSKAHTEDEIKCLPLISGKHETIWDIQEKGRWLYGFTNIKRIVNVVTLAPNLHRKWKPRMTKKGKAIHVFPTMLLGILWDHIDPDHKILLKDGQSWNFRGKLMQRLKKREKIILDNWIRDAAKHQDLSYQAWLSENGVTNRVRPPTFFPGDDWTNAPVQPTKTKSRTKSNSKSSDLDSLGNGPPREENHGKKRPRANSGANSGRTKKLRPGSASTEKSTERSIDYRSYLFTNMMHFGLTDEKREKDPEEYRQILGNIEQDWTNYRQNMINRGFTVAPGGEKPEA
ncbi:uncharacterized protein N7458_005006 [Penicillium daleae]|uniref:Uncharacterized protein n=1 Tax=Penicillium daleae TaxID=63821 RepID=A0AAD6C7H0_9EURO|nr:uncharacterized protein N7458_005006 [Penicillium daleae]KAJ5454050.1 hypothetical protein N7458_005006 [Penicillium daleae]